ncbi:hypothetical protein E4656_16100 [Natronospirillum operosum]|uniref:Uncharacterized protein n=1 Tax=Natronospirillum operosum TaxID=2759953 RepID=A0A4Z0W7M4_9GAMM|nr:hypothetical protein [Natronospirillum operosum]TGG91550.1 hypothetical protein E4656_16100 [Natronospirillum operosum]
MTDYSSRVHIRPFLIVLDVVAVLCLLVGLHDLLRPEIPLVHPNLQFDGYLWVLLLGGLILGAISVWTLIRMFSGKGVVSAEDIG